MIVAISAQRLNVRPVCCSHSRVNTSAVAVRRRAANAFPVSQSSPCDHHAPSVRTHTPIAAMARGSHVRGRTRPPILRASRRSIHEGCRCVPSALMSPEEHRRPDGSPAPVPRPRRSSNRGRGSRTSYGSGSTRTGTQQPRCRWSQYGPSLLIVPDGTIAQAAVEMER